MVIPPNASRASYASFWRTEPARPLRCRAEHVSLDRLCDRAAAVHRSGDGRNVVLEARRCGGPAFLLSELFRAGRDDRVWQRLRGRAAAGAGDGAFSMASGGPVFVRRNRRRRTAWHRGHVSAGFLAIPDARRGLHLASLRGVVERARTAV